MSLAPGRPTQPNFSRSSSGGNLADLGMSTAQRTSSQTFMGASSRKSLMPGMFSLGSTTPGPQQPLQDFQRRSSVYGARQSMGLGQSASQSFFATAPPQSSMPVDPRKLKDPNFRTQMCNEIMEFLTQKNFEMEMKHTLTHKTLTSPTQKDFVMVFQFLYHCIDPGYRFQKSIDAEVPPLLKQLRYPFERNISKSQLAAVGGNNWATFLGMLHWMMQLAKMMSAYAVGQYDHACLEAGFDVRPDRVTYKFIVEAYQTWMSVPDDEEGDDEAQSMLQPHLDGLAQAFAEINAQNVEQLEAQEEVGRELQMQIEDLNKNAPRLTKLDEQIQILEEDRIKFENYNNSMDAKVEKYEHRAVVLAEEIRKMELELQQAEEEKRALQEQVDAQGITIQDIDRMNADRKRLQTDKETTSARLEDRREATMVKESEAGQKLQELEESVSNYNSLGYQIGIIPSSGTHAGGQKYELVLTVNPETDFTSSRMIRPNEQESDRLLGESGNGYQAHQLVNLDLRGSVKSNIVGLRKEISERRNAAYEKDMANVELLDKIKEAIDDKQAEVEALGHRVRAAEQEFDETKETTSAQKMQSDAQIEKMEKELQRMRANLTESVQLMEAREVNANIE